MPMGWERIIACLGRVNGHDQGGMGAGSRGVAAGAGAAGEGEAKDGFGQVVKVDQVESLGQEGFLGDGELDAEKVGALGEPGEMSGPVAGLTVGNADGFEQAIAIEETAIEDRDGG